MTDYTRVTVVGASRKVELVIPSDIALAGLLPRLIELLDEKTGSAARPLTLVRTTGEELDLALSASDQSLDDGELLRLVRQDEAPPPPEIADVTDVLAEQHGSREGLWSAGARGATGAIAVGLFAGAGAFMLAAEPLLRSDLILPGLLGAAVLIAVIAGRVGGRWVAIAATAAALGLVPATAWALTAGLDGTSRVMVAAGGGVAAAWLVVAAGIGIGLAARPALWGGLLGAGLAAIPAALALAAWPQNGMLGVTGIVATIACGLLPWYAMSASGLTGLDDEVVDGRPRRREAVLKTADAAYRTLSWSVAAVALPIGASTAVLLSSGDPWSLGLGAALLIVAALRTRSLVLTVQIVTLWVVVLAAAATAVTLTPLLPAWGRALALLVLTIAAAVAAGVRPAAHQSASLRRIGNALETLAVIAAFPLLLGVFGIYADLLEAI
jgi:type VII secretion integral membrane protein EccD